MRRMSNIEIVLTGPYSDMELQPENGYVPQSLDLGWPSVRDNRDLRPQQSGEDDYTQFFGARAVTIAVGVAGELVGKTDEHLLDELNKWMLPELRSWIEYRRKGETVWRRIGVKATQLSNRLTLSSFRYDIPTLSFRAPEGTIDLGPTNGNRNFNLEVIGLYPSLQGEKGRLYDSSNKVYNTGNKIYPETEVIGSGVANNRGTARAWPIAIVYGPCKRPRIINYNDDLELTFKDDFEVLSGQFLEIDFLNGTVSLNGDITNSRFNEVDFSVSEFFSLAPRSGTLVRFDPAEYSPPSHVDFMWRSTNL